MAVNIGSVIIDVILFFIFNKLTTIARIFIGLYFFFDILEITLLQVARGFAENKAYSVASVILSLSNLFLILVFWMRNSLNLEAVMFSLSISSALATLYLYLIIKKHAEISIKHISITIIKEMLSYSWPMVFNNLSRWSLSLSDRLVITAFLGIEANAVYAVATKIPNLLATLQGTFSMAWQENASLVISDKDSTDYYSNMFDTFFCFLCGLLAMLIAATPILFSILIKGDYKSAYAQMPILFIGMLFDGMAAYLGGIYVASKRTKSIGITTIIAAAINLIIDFLLINKVGITAGSISTMVSYLFLMIYRMIDIQKIQAIKYRISKMFILIGTMIFMSIMCWMQVIWIDIINVCLAFFVAIFINKKIIIVLYKMIKNKIPKA